MAKVTLASLRRQRGFELADLAAECRKHKGGEGVGTTQVSAYLTGRRPIGDTHFRILCLILRVKPEDVYTVRFLVGGRQPLATPT